jgi:RNA-directed DNA polymerase
MLTALEQGVLGGKWHSLRDKVYALPNLRKAFEQVKANRGAAGVDQVTVKEFERDLEANLEKLARSLREGKYRPQAIRWVWIPKPGSNEKRPLGIPTVRDRVVQAALRALLEPIFERDFAAQSYGFRPNRGCKDALRRVDTLLKAGYPWVVDADLKSYFDNMDHEWTMKFVQHRVADKRILRLIQKWLKAGVSEDGEWSETNVGTPQGAVVSMLLANVYLHYVFDLWVEAEESGGRRRDRSPLRRRLGGGVRAPGGSRAVPRGFSRAPGEVRSGAARRENAANRVRQVCPE